VLPVVAERRLAVSTRVLADDTTLGVIIEEREIKPVGVVVRDKATEMVGVQWGLSESMTIRSPGWIELASNAIAVSTVSSFFTGMNRDERRGACDFRRNPAPNSFAATSPPLLPSSMVVSKGMNETLRPARLVGLPNEASQG
jgi:hypothetical protein